MLYIILGIVIGILLIALIVEHIKRKKFQERANQVNKHWDFYVIMKKWMENRNHGKFLKEYFEKYPYKKVAIYGVGDLGKMLAFELKDSKINISYFIDRSGEGVREYEGSPVITIVDIKNMEPVDAIIVTPLLDYNDVNSELIRKGITTPTISLRDIIYEV